MPITVIYISLTRVIKTGYVTVFKQTVNTISATVQPEIYCAGLSIRDSSSYFYPLKMVIGTS
jgi:hypothetical protein